MALCEGDHSSAIQDRACGEFPSQSGQRVSVWSSVVSSDGTFRRRPLLCDSRQGLWRISQPIWPTRVSLELRCKLGWHFSKATTPLRFKTGLVANFPANLANACQFGAPL